MKNLLVAFLIIPILFSFSVESEVTYHCTANKQWKEQRKDFPQDTIYTRQFQAKENGKTYVFQVIKDCSTGQLIRVTMKTGETVLFTTMNSYDPLSRNDLELQKADENGVILVDNTTAEAGSIHTINFKEENGGYRPMTLTLGKYGNVTVYNFDF